MSKFFNIVFLFFISFSALYSSEYKVSLLSSECPAGRIYAINDLEQVLFIPHDNSQLFLYDRKTGFIPVEDKSKITSAVMLNNATQVIGYGYPKGQYKGFYMGDKKPFIWSQEAGIQWLDIFDSKYAFLNDLNDLGQVIGNYTPAGLVDLTSTRPFIWENGTATDMGPGSEFAQSIENLGYHVMEIHLKSINNKGELVGYFGYGKLNTKSQNYVLVGYESFYCDGNIHIISLPIDVKSLPGEMKVNDRGSVMIVANPSPGLTKTYLWNLENGVKVIDDFYGAHLNNFDVILGQTITYGRIAIEKPLLWKNGEINSFEKLIGVDDIFRMAPKFSDTYDIEGLSEFRDMNNKGQITCQGYIWGDLYPCLLEPSE